MIVLGLYAEYQAAALAVGADAFVSKGEPPERLLAALSTVARAPGVWKVDGEATRRS